MTVVLALRHADGVTIGSDSQWSGDGFKWMEDSPKYFLHGDCVIGYSGDARQARLFEAMPQLRPPRADETPINYIAHVVAEAIRQTHILHGCEIKDPAAVIVWRGCVYEMGERYGVFSPSRGYAAAGSGASVALGAVDLALRFRDRMNPPLSPEEIVTSAIESAIEHTDSVGGKIHVLNIKSRARKPKKSQ